MPKTGRGLAVLHIIARGSRKTPPRLTYLGRELAKRSRLQIIIRLKLRFTRAGARNTSFQIKQRIAQPKRIVAHWAEHRSSVNQIIKSVDTAMRRIWASLQQNAESLLGSSRSDSWYPAGNVISY